MYATPIRGTETNEQKPDIVNNNPLINPRYENAIVNPDAIAAIVTITQTTNAPAMKYKLKIIGLIRDSTTDDTLLNDV